ncbi:hypothetical protein PQR66_19340 [Paraburkholderia agricolaris]|uniref:T6SS Tle3 phospholipase effector alpha/beta domain-containing protein n=1 Tax=Paraburkholderia agricolaris TaxID=2152888 RepID=A0ABW8ZQD3_9BURK
MTDSTLNPADSPDRSAPDDANATTASGAATDQSGSSTAQPPSSGRIEVGSAQGVSLIDKDNELVCVKQMPLPGVVIFVHGVNSEGEWYTPAEKGLCDGLNRRLGRLDDQMVHKGVVGGQMSPASYIESLTPQGYINPKMTSNTYINPDPSFSPIIHFRWGYKANKDEMKLFGANIMLNEQNYWGGGPFANGCSSLADLWSEGIDDRVFGWITVQAMNPSPRKIYRTPPRAYGVMAALRLAKLIQSIRQKQADVPITVVCHSQGNMVGLAAAFLGDRMSPVSDRNQPSKTGRCVADTYVLANPPYSLVNEIGMDNWTQRESRDSNGNRGRETYTARAETLSNYFDILRERAALEPDADKLDREMTNTLASSQGGKPYDAQADRKAHGLNGKTFGRVTLYCCPHDQVISTTTVQGIGWRGMSADEINASNGNGVFTQRVFATGYEVGQDPGTGGMDKAPKYHYWNDDWRKSVNRSKGFWYPPSPPAKFGFMRALRANDTLQGQIGTTLTAPLLYLATLVVKMRVNANPDKDWAIPVTAPKLDEPFTPLAMRYNKPVKVEVDGLTSDFNETYDPPSAARDASKSDKDMSDPYDRFNGKTVTMAAQGDTASEASQRYDDHAALRQDARREDPSGDKGWVDDQGNVTGEDDPSQASPSYKKWHDQQITEVLKGGDHDNPTNHSTIMTSSTHAEKSLAYDLAIGISDLSSQDWADLRIEADWRFGKGMDKSNPNRKYTEYFQYGTYDNRPVQEWAKDSQSEGAIPGKIKDQREGGSLLKAGDFV